MLRFLLLFSALFIGSFTLSAQDVRLAQVYYSNGEYEKAASLYQSLYEQSPTRADYFDRYIDCLTALEDYDSAEDILKKRLKSEGDNLQLYVLWGNLLEKQGKEKEAENQYEKALKKIGADQGAILRLASSFTSNNKYDYAVRAYEEGEKALKMPGIFAYNQGELYRRMGDMDAMIESYLEALNANPNRANSITSIFQRNLLEEADLMLLQQKLFERIQKEQDAIHYPEMLSWVYLQRKDYRGALRQAKALDKRLDESGKRIFRLAEIAAEDANYDIAIDAYQYIIDEKGSTGMFYITAKERQLWCLREQLTAGYSYTPEDLMELEGKYNAFLDEFGRNTRSAQIILELSELQALYLDDLPKAIAQLNELIAFPGIPAPILAESKLRLADYYLITGERWESTLLYSQVDKDHPDDIFGHEARFRNAKLSYFNADFEWAQAQFSVLKASTSKLIANDALDLSVFIMDNMGLDSTAEALEVFSTSELLIFQNKLDEANSILESLPANFPEHALEDDVLYMQAQIHLKKREYTEAAALFLEITERFNEEIRADNALFELAELYEKQLAQPEVAKGYYEKLFLEYSGSTFAVEARKRYRKLRGDTI